MKATIEIEDIDEDRFIIRSHYEENGVYDDTSPSHREVWKVMQMIKDGFIERGFKIEDEE